MREFCELTVAFLVIPAILLYFGLFAGVLIGFVAGMDEEYIETCGQFFGRVALNHNKDFEDSFDGYIARTLVTLVSPFMWLAILYGRRVRRRRLL